MAKHLAVRERTGLPGAMRRREPADVPTHVPACELAALADAGAFWRLAPAWVPREFASPTTELMQRVERGLRRRCSDGA